MEISDSIHDFWFSSHPDDAIVSQQKSSLWWSKKQAVDQEIRDRFELHVEAAARHELDEWTTSGRTLLALLLLTDQFPRNMYRNTSRAFAYDALAQAWCLAGLEQGMDRGLRPIERVFFYLPLEHAESVALQERSVQLYTKLFQDVPAAQADLFRGYLTFALRHRRIITRFGRFPHRNAILGRPSTPEEVIFLQEPGSSF